MKSLRIGACGAPALRTVQAVIAAALIGAVVACGGGSGTTPTTAGGGSIRQLPAEFSTRKAVSYSPYRTSTNSSQLDAEVITEAQVKEDLDLLAKAGFGLIRVFSSNDKVAKLALQVIFKYAIDMKVQLGAYTTGDVYVTDAQRAANEANNQAELARAVALARQYRDIVIAVSVGNETQVDFSGVRTKPETLARYLKTVRDQITQPVTTDDNWAPFAAGDNLILNNIDYVSMHSYPELDTVFNPTLFDWKQTGVAAAGRAQAMINANITEAKRQYGQVRAALDKRGLNGMPVTIGETGWNAVNLGALRFRAHPVNQKLYYDALQTWAAEGRNGNGPKAIIYFEAFDEQWKQGDDGWGLFNKKREARYVIQGLGTCNVTWTCEPGTYMTSDAVYYADAVANAAVSANRYKIYTDAAAPGTSVQAAGLRWDAFGGSTAAYPDDAAYAAPADGGTGTRITPTPADYGWGLLRQPTDGSTENLSAFATTGNLVFSIKTTYAGKIEIGVITDTVNRDGAEAFLQISNGQYGYKNNGEWTQVTIPLKDFVAANPKLDLSLVVARFVIADRYSATGNFARSGQPQLFVDGIYWQK